MKIDWELVDVAGAGIIYIIFAVCLAAYIVWKISDDKDDDDTYGE